MNGEVRPAVVEPLLEAAETIRLGPAVEDDGRERREHERTAACGQRRIGAEPGAIEPQACRPLADGRRRPLFGHERPQLERREARERAREHGEELDVAEPRLGAEEGAADQRRGDVGEHQQGERSRLLRRPPDQLEPRPDEQQPDRRPLTEPCGVGEGLHRAPREHAVERARRHVQWRDTLPDVADEP